MSAASQIRDWSRELLQRKRYQAHTLLQDTPGWRCMSPTASHSVSENLEEGGQSTDPSGRAALARRCLHPHREPEKECRAVIDAYCARRSGVRTGMSSAHGNEGYAEAPVRTCTGLAEVGTLPDRVTATRES